MDPLNYDVYLFHGPCIDGHTSAAILWSQQPLEVREYLCELGGMYSPNRKTREEGSKYPHTPDNALKIVGRWTLKSHTPRVFVFATPGVLLPPSLIQGKRVLSIDLDPGKQCLLQLMSLTTHTLLLDHHESFRDTCTDIGAVITPATETLISSNLTVYWDPCKSVSGATLAWKYFGTSKNVPHIVEVVQIGDTWNWNQNKELMPRECLEALTSDDTLTSFDGIVQLLDNDAFMAVHPKLIAHGKCILEVKNTLIDQGAKRCSLGYIESAGTVYTILYTSASILASEIGDRMKGLHTQWWLDTKGITIDFTAVWRYVPASDSRDGRVTVSLRGASKDANLGHIARNVANILRGGGHKQAAAFTFIGIENIHKYILKCKPTTVPCSAPAGVRTSGLLLPQITSTLPILKNHDIPPVKVTRAKDFSPLIDALMALPQVDLTWITDTLLSRRHESIDYIIDALLIHPSDFSPLIDILTSLNVEDLDCIGDIIASRGNITSNSLVNDLVSACDVSR